MTARRSSGSSLAATIAPGVLAGIAGGVLSDAYILSVGSLTHGIGPVQHYTIVASALVGRAAYTMPAAVSLGVAVHFAISIAWGIGYAYAAVTTPQILARPIFSGTLFGLVVLVVMQIVTALAGVGATPSRGPLLGSIVSYTIFFGIPVAFVVTRRLRKA